MEQSTNEIWRPVVGYEGSHEVSNIGRVRSVTRVVIRSNGRPHTVPGRVLATHPMEKGHRRITLNKLGRLRTFTVHSLVLEAFVGPRPEGAVCRHLNGDPADNRVENLRWGTGSENQYDAVRHGSHYLASKTHCKRGHPFSGPNLATRGGSRVCVACRREAGNAHAGGRPFDDALADARYRDVMAGIRRGRNVSKPLRGLSSLNG